MKEMIVTVTDEGNIRIETRGFTGKACIDEAQFLKDVLGKETARSLTPTYWQQNHQQNGQNVKKYLPLCG